MRARACRMASSIGGNDFVAVAQHRRSDRPARPACAGQRGDVVSKPRVGRRDGALDAKRFLILREHQQQAVTASPTSDPQSAIRAASTSSHFIGLCSGSASCGFAVALGARAEARFLHSPLVFDGRAAARQLGSSADRRAVASRSDTPSSCCSGASARRCGSGAPRERPLHSVRAAIWRDPRRVERLDLAAGPGGRRRAASAVHLHRRALHRIAAVRVGARCARRAPGASSGATKCRSKRSRRGWRGRSATSSRPPTTSPRDASNGVRALKRAGSCIDAEGRFTDARFELEEEDVIKHFDEHSWAWNDNPFVGHARAERPEDRDDVAVELGREGRARRRARIEHRDLRVSHAGGGREARYLIIDWGGALGRWGSIVSRGRWDCRRVCRADAGVRAGRRRRVRAVGLHRPAHGRHRRRHPRQRREMAAAAISDGCNTRRLPPRCARAAAPPRKAQSFAGALIERVDRLSGAVSAASPSGTPAPLPSAAAL